MPVVTGCGYSNHTRIHTSIPVTTPGGGLWSPEKPVDAHLDFCPWPAKTQSARGDEPVRVWPARPRSVMEVEADGGGRDALPQEPRPGGEVGKVEKGIGAPQANLPGKHLGVLGAGTAGDDRARVAEDGGAQPVGELVEVLVADYERKRVFARLGQYEGEALGGEGLELVGIKMEHAPLGRGGIRAGERGLRQRRGEERTEQVRGALSRDCLLRGCR